eukprot:TRINITY_DN24354_c0_g1_i1.p2 TRINITY_DN24354_c0_g1~~TRINITY_DN24354_c0_g1_i1.p2  ORF type:complete len:142 (-),score=61.16 TRINITY_DN24354_c0_g1_i1:176-601(-)
MKSAMLVAALFVAVAAFAAVESRESVPVVPPKKAGGFNITIVSEICVTNDAGFDLHWSMKDMYTNLRSQDSGSYPIDQSRCLNINTIPGVGPGHVVLCTVSADGGETQDCDWAVLYDPNSTNTATFVCSGTTLIFGCKRLG